MEGIIFIIFIGIIWLLRAFVWDEEEGTLEQRIRNPELNTKDWDLHEIRLERFAKSKYKKRLFYMSPTGSCYYYSSTGTKIYC